MLLGDITDIPWEAIAGGLALFALQVINAWLARNVNRKADATLALATETKAVADKTDRKTNSLIQVVDATKVIADQTKIVAEATHVAGNSMLTGVREQMVVMAELLVEAKPSDENQARLSIAKRDLETQLKSQGKVEAAVEAKANK